MCIGVYRVPSEWRGICDVTIGTCVCGQDTLCSHHCSVLDCCCIYGDQEGVVWNAYLYGTVGVCLIV